MFFMIDKKTAGNKLFIKTISRWIIYYLSIFIIILFIIYYF